MRWLEATGMARVKEVLETVDWSGSGSGLAQHHTLDPDSNSDNDDDDNPAEQERCSGTGDRRKDKDLAAEVEDLERELFGLTQPLVRQGCHSIDDQEGKEEGDGSDDGNKKDDDDDEDEDMQIQDLERIMARMQALRGTFKPSSRH